MPDTMLAPQSEAPVIPACGIMDSYRSPAIGKLVSARAKASAKIKAIIKDKRAKIESRKEGGRAYEYAYADLSSVLDAVEDAVSEQGLAILQTTQDRGRDGTFLVTTLAHESDQWVAADIRLKSADAGPQVYGSEMTYLRRYAVLAILALAPEADDDGAAAQDRADQARQRPVQRPEQPRRQPAPQKQMAPQEAPSAPEGAAFEPDEPIHMAIVNNDIKTWSSDAWDALCERPATWRAAWLVLHRDELERVRVRRPDWAQNIEDLANEPDMAAE